MMRMSRRSDRTRQWAVVLTEDVEPDAEAGVKEEGGAKKGTVSAFADRLLCALEYGCGEIS